MVVNFKNFVTKALVGSKKQSLNMFADEFNNIRLIGFNESTSSTPQVIQMTTCVEQILNLSQNAFKKLTHELITTSFDLQEHVKTAAKMKQEYLNMLAEEKQRFERLAKQQQQKEAIRQPKINNFMSESFRLQQNLNVNFDSESKLSGKSDESVRRLSVDNSDFKKKLKENEFKINELQQVIEGLKQEVENYKNTNFSHEKSVNLVDEEGIPSIMFTKLDAERNAKRLKKAINKGIVSEQEYEVEFIFLALKSLKFQIYVFKNAYQLMDNYVSLPERRWAELVKKYVHHKKMKIIKGIIRLCFRKIY
jgi:hypothetical protein